MNTTLLVRSFCSSQIKTSILGSKHPFGCYSVYGSGPIDKLMTVVLKSLGFFFDRYRPVSLCLNDKQNCHLSITKGNLRKCLTKLIQNKALAEQSFLDSKKLEKAVNTYLEKHRAIQMDEAALHFMSQFERAKSQTTLKIVSKLSEIINEASHIEVPLYVHQTNGNISFETMTDPMWVDGRITFTENHAISIKTTIPLASSGYYHLGLISQELKKIPQTSWKLAAKALKKELMKTHFCKHVAPFYKHHVPPIFIQNKPTTGHKVQFAKQSYIACPSPNPNHASFWQLAFEQGAEFIIKLADGSTYWPVAGEIFTYGDNLTVRLVEEKSLMENLISRTFEIQLGEVKKKITQIDYLGWSDASRPNLEEFSLFLSIFDDLKKDSLKPIMVHCANGYGRTGTFLAAHQLKLQPNVDLTDTIMNMRKQCPFPMVETYEQFKFLNKFVS